MSPETKRTMAFFLIPFVAVCAQAHATPARHRAPRQSQPTTTAAPATPAPAQRIVVTVDASGYHPATIHATPDRPVTLVFTRTSNQGCGQQVVFPSLNVRRDLALNQPVEVTVTPTAGTLAFTCGMNMLRGSIVVQ